MFGRKNVIIEQKFQQLLSTTQDSQPQIQSVLAALHNNLSRKSGSSTKSSNPYSTTFLYLDAQNMFHKQEINNPQAFQTGKTRTRARWKFHSALDAAPNQNNLMSVKWRFALCM